MKMAMDSRHQNAMATCLRTRSWYLASMAPRPLTKLILAIFNLHALRAPKTLASQPAGVRLNSTFFSKNRTNWVRIAVLTRQRGMSWRRTSRARLMLTSHLSQNQWSRWIHQSRLLISRWIQVNLVVHSRIRRIEMFHRSPWNKTRRRPKKPAGVPERAKKPRAHQMY